MPKLAKVHSSIAAEKLRALGWTLAHELRAAPHDDPYEYLLRWDQDGEPAYPRDDSSVVGAEPAHSDPEVSYQVVMGSKNPGAWQKGSVADLYARFFDPVARYIPPRAVLNDKLRSGIERAGEHGIHIRWEPLELTPLQFDVFCARLLSAGEPQVKRHILLSAPTGLETWEAWTKWVYETQIEPQRISQADHARAVLLAKSLTDLKRRYRRALVDGDATEATVIAERIRKEHDPSFS